jgi:hypothetical protein
MAVIDVWDIEPLLEELDLESFAPMGLIQSQHVTPPTPPFWGHRSHFAERCRRKRGDTINRCELRARHYCVAIRPTGW